MTLLDGLDEIDWTALRHAYGEAGDVPGLLRGIVQGPDPDDALFDLRGKIYHQGGIVCSAARAALPYLVALAGGSVVAVRPGLLKLIGSLVGVANTVSWSWVDDDWPDAWAAALPRVLSLLDDPDVAVRRVLTSTLSAARADADAVVPALRARWDVENDGAVRLGIIIASGELAEGSTADVLSEALLWLRDLRRHDDPQIRLATEMALAKAVRAQRPDPQVLVAAVRGDITVWRDTPWVGDIPADLQESYGGRAARLLGWLGHRLGDDTAACTELATAFIDDGDSDRRIGAVQIAEDVLSAAHSPVVPLLPGLVRRSTDESSAVRACATHLLAALDEGDADLLAARLDDDAPLSWTGDGRIADIAACGLARRNDPRCLPRLLDRLTGNVWFPVADRTLLAPLGGHADALLPAIRARLVEPDIARGLAGALAEWGAAPAPAVPELIRLIGTDATIEAARALGAIGPSAADAVPALAAPFHSENLTQEQFARMIYVSSSLIAMVETGKRTPKPSFIKSCDQALNTGGALARLWKRLIESSYLEWFRPVVEIEADADSMIAYEAQAVPGLLQTEDYARAPLRTGPARDSEQKIEQHVAARMNRQQILTRDAPPLFWTRTFCTARSVARRSCATSSRGWSRRRSPRTSSCRCCRSLPERMPG
ncbi:Uncharacterised protein [Mycobacterium tuberculosis]|nr:Uncharacterised protein [Mycobacterium tuberculosis]